MNRVGWVFVLAGVFAIIVSLLTPASAAGDTIRTDDVSFRTSTRFNVGAAIVMLILVGLYSVFW